MPDQTLTVRAPFQDLPLAGIAGGGVLVADRDGLGIASVLVRKNASAALAERVRALFGIELPRGPRRSVRGDIAFAATGPGTWLATREEGGDAFAASLIERIGDIAAVADQSSGYAILRVTGPRLRDTLAKILPIDLHERAFAPGDVAATNASHVNVTLWRLADASDGSPVFEIAMFRSLAESFWHGFAASAAEFGVDAARAGTSRIEIGRNSPTP